MLVGRFLTYESGGVWVVSSETGGKSLFSEKGKGWFLKCQFWDIGRNPAGYNKFEVGFRNQEFGRVSLSQNGICKQEKYL